MGRKKKRGAQPGNLNGCKHPWSSLWRRKVVPEELKWIVPAMTQYRLNLERDKGNMTVSEKRIGEIATLSRACTLLIMDAAFQNGFIRKTEDNWGLTDGVKDLPRFMAREMDALKAIGLESRAVEVESLEAYVNKLKTGKAVIETTGKTESDNGDSDT